MLRAVSYFLVLTALAGPAPKTVVLSVDDGKPFGALARSHVQALALTHQPSLAAARATIREAESAFTSARLYPNPELNFETEEQPRDFDFGPGLLMTTINQTIITGGKRQWRMRAAEAGVSRVALQYEQAALEAVRNATQAYYALLAANRKLVASREIAALADEFHRKVQARVEGGVARPIEGDRALVLTTQARVDLRRIEADRVTARQALATAIGVPVSRFTTDPVGELEHKGTLPEYGVLLSQALARSPALKEPRLDEDVARAELGLARSLRVPDVTAGISFQHRSVTDGSHDLRGIRINVPLPVINTGQAERAKARAQIDGARSRQLVARQALENRLTAAHQTALRAHDQIESYLHEILPAARRAISTSLEGYEAGEFSYIEVLDAQRSLASSNQSYFDVLLEYQKARAELEEIVAGAVPETPEAAEHHETHEEPR